MFKHIPDKDNLSQILSLSSYILKHVYFSTCPLNINVKTDTQTLFQAVHLKQLSQSLLF